MADKIYFFRTISDGIKDRLRPLPFQTDSAGRDVITQLNVQADKRMRESYPIGTIFASEMLEDRVSGSTPFYSAGEIFPVSIKQSELLESSHCPTDQMLTEYANYLTTNKDRLDINLFQSSAVNAADPRKGKLLTLLDKFKLNPNYQLPTIETDGFWVDEETWGDLMMNIHENVNTLFKGPAGSGKTELVQLACERLKLPCHIYDMGSMYDPISDLLGVHRMTAQGSVFDYAQFTQDIQHEGVILLDELSRATPAVNNILMPCLDSRRTLRVEMAGRNDKREIPVHPKCRFVATANLGAEYVGTSELDLALRDRFDEMDIDYMPNEQEILMLMKRFKITRVDAQNIVKTASTIRSIARKGEIEFSITTRETIRAAKKVQEGWSTTVAMKRAFLPRYEGTISEGSRAIVWNTILQK